MDGKTEWTNRSVIQEWIIAYKSLLSAGIPDFRSGMDTVLPTGPGVWEVRAQGTARANSKVVPILRAMPTSTHMSIVKLHETGDKDWGLYISVTLL